MTFSHSTPSVKHPGGEKSIRSGGYQGGLRQTLAACVLRNPRSTFQGSEGELGL